MVTISLALRYELLMISTMPSTFYMSNLVCRIISPIYCIAVRLSILLFIIISWKMNQETFKPDQPASIRFREIMLKVAKGLYFTHLFLSGIFAGILIIMQPDLRISATLTLGLVILYGFILIWLLLFNLFSVCISKEKWAVWCNRFFAKLIIMVFPFLCLPAYCEEHFLHLPWVAVFMLYQLAFSTLMILYQLYACTCGHHDEPSFLYHSNDLVKHTNEVWSRRKEFLKNKALSSPARS